MSDPLAIVLFSGTADKLMAAANLAAGAVALGREVTVFLTFGGLLAFRKDDWRQNQTLSPDQGRYADEMRAAMRQAGLPSWLQVLQDARELGTLRIAACRLTLEMFHLALDDLEPLVTETATVGDVMAAGQHPQLLFI
ncbi:MAG: DsrE/DsrF/DrsH-like family protein [Verrucomicrobia bacterium]|nr:DsrE/DsrF/DrsH-like family protein [Verrucomicrobiota bacterium]